MKKYIILFVSLSAFLLAGCSDFLDRPQKSAMDDTNYWTNENNLRLFANGYYVNYFTGYFSGWSVDYTPLRGYYFSDDFTSAGTQSAFEASAPASRSGTSETPSMLIQYAGPSWNFAWVRKSNLFLERINTMKESGYLTEDAYNHWSAVARFFRGYEYSRLVSVFGDVPYYDRVVSDTELEELYKDRQDRIIAMDGVYEDFVYVLEKMRVNDGTNYLNKYIAAGFISRFMLFEGTWQKYHKNNQTLAKKYLDLAVRAGDIVIQSGKYSFDTDFRSLFGSEDLSKMKEVLMYRHYSDAEAVRHHVASYSNLNESQAPAPNLALAKSFLCNDGKPYKLSSVANAGVLDITNMVATRDPRFEATFWDHPMISSSTLLYACKFIDRVGVTYYGKTVPAKYGSNTNTNGYPVMRYAEVVLNWIEAKAELATMGGTAVTQADLDASINAIRKRPLDATAIAKGIKKTASMSIAAIPDDPDRDSDVSPLLWEIRRERRMEFVYEHTRLLDIKRWKKIDYMSGTMNPDMLLGLWINFQQELPTWLIPSKVNVLKVMKQDGTVVTYNGSNGADMVGYYIPQTIKDRDPFTDRVYLAPLGNAQIDAYKDKGYVLTQNPGWN